MVSRRRCHFARCAGIRSYPVASRALPRLVTVAVNCSRHVIDGCRRDGPHAQQPNALAMTTCWISFVPSPISSTFESQ